MNQHTTVGPDIPTTQGWVVTFSDLEIRPLHSWSRVRCEDSGVEFLQPAICYSSAGAPTRLFTDPDVFGDVQSHLIVVCDMSELPPEARELPDRCPHHSSWVEPLDRAQMAAR